MEEWRSFLRMAMIDADCDHRDFASVALIDFSSFRSFRHLLVKDGRAHCYVNALTGNAADPSCVCVHVCVFVFAFVYYFQRTRLEVARKCTIATADAAQP
jgi:hypothetical protein